MTNNAKKNLIETDSCSLHIIAMIFMLMDHLWGSWLIPAEILTCAGRIAFPVFAFLSVEGFFYTKDRKAYLLRLLLFAVISEVPFDLMTSGTAFYPFHQNVLWTFLAGHLLMLWMNRIRRLYRREFSIVLCSFVMFAGFIAGYIFMVDYYGAGIITMFVFYWTHEEKLLNKLIQLICLYIINVEMLGGYYYPVTIAGHYFELQQQALALLSLPLIWAYHGKQGFHSRWFRWFCYGFYPAHCLILFILVKLIR